MILGNTESGYGVTDRYTETPASGKSDALSVAGSEGCVEDKVWGKFLAAVLYLKGLACEADIAARSARKACQCESHCPN